MSSDPVDRQFSRINESTASDDDLGAELEDSLTLYFRGLGRVPILSQAQERALFRRREAGDERAKRLLVEANLPLVIWIARQYAHRDVPLLDLIQEGNVALTRAVEKFDHRLGFRLSTYATLSIRGAVERAAERHARVITVSVSSLLQKRDSGPAGSWSKTPSQLIRKRGSSSACKERRSRPSSTRSTIASASYSNCGSGFRERPRARSSRSGRSWE